MTVMDRSPSPSPWLVRASRAIGIARETGKRDWLSYSVFVVRRSYVWIEAGRGALPFCTRSTVTLHTSGYIAGSAVRSRRGRRFSLRVDVTAPEGHRSRYPERARSGHGRRGAALVDGQACAARK